MIPDSPQKTAGIATGAAAAVLKWRENDGADFSTAYTPGNGPGAYQFASGTQVDSCRPDEVL